jgi:short-subunit dehydrogenase
MNGSEKPRALITGATSGIGEAFARRFAHQGYNLIITGRRKEKINRLAHDLTQTCAVNVEVIISELSNPGDVDALAQKVRDTENLDILVNNAGFTTKRYFLHEDREGQEKMVQVHVVTPMKLTYAALPNMIAQGKGAIINVSSLGAFTPFPTTATYSGTKAFLVVFTESLHLELAGTNVKVQALCPGFTRTDFHERIGMDKSKQKNVGIIRWMSPEKVVHISLRCLKKNKVICVPGFWNKVLRFATHKLLPRSLYYKSVSGLAASRKS